MKLRIKQIGELYDEEREPLYFNRPYKAEIINDQNIIIGEISGCYIDTFFVYVDTNIYNGDNFKSEAEELINLGFLPNGYLSCVSYVINDVIKATPKLHNIIYLNKIEIAEEYASKECESAVFDMMFEQAEMLVYDLDRDALYGKFITSQSYWTSYESTLRELGWILEKDHGYYIKSREDLWDIAHFEKRAWIPWETIELIPSEIEFWELMFNRPSKILYSEMEENNFKITKATDDTGDRNSAFNYQYAKEMSAVISEWKINNFFGPAPKIDLTPFTLSYFLLHIIFLYQDVSIASMSVLEKYKKIFDDLAAFTGFHEIYSFMMLRYVMDKDLFTTKRLFLMEQKDMLELRKEKYRNKI